MAISLRQNEEIKCKAYFHWASYILPGIWAFFWGAAPLIGFVGMALERSPEQQSLVGPFIWMLIFAFFPLMYAWLKNNTRAYVVTNQRLYVEEGILSKTKTDIPLAKINDISFDQGIFQRLFGTGNILVMTGNDKPTKIKNLDFPDQFRETLSKCCNSKAS
jgi:uncharacterized membrane protein YdbT with pleckstrin-like domain